MGKEKPRDIDAVFSDAVYDAQMEMQKKAEQSVGSEIERFVNQDAIYVGVLLISGILLLASTQMKGITLAGILLALYQLVLVLTLVSYAYLRIVRRKRYGPDENTAIALAGKWLIYSGMGVIAAFLGIMFILTTFKGMNPPREFAVFTTGAGVLAGSAYFLKTTYRHERAGAFALLMADGLAWVLTLGGIGALVLTDAAYGILTVLHIAGIPFA